MDPQDILNLLLSQLPLDSKTAKFVREIFLEIWNSNRNLINSRDWRTESPTPSEIKDTAAKLRKLIALFNSAVDDRDEFFVVFPQWETKRKESIKKLGDIAKSMQESRQNCSIAQIVGGSVGLMGGLAIIGSVLLPPVAPALLPIGVTSSLALGGSIAAGAGSVTQMITSATEAAISHNRIEEAKQICRQDKESFDKMMKWFECTHQLETALNNLFEMDILDLIFKDLKDFFGYSNLNIGTQPSLDLPTRRALKNCVGKILNRKSVVFPSFDAAVMAITFSMFLIHRRNRCLFHCVILTHKLFFELSIACNANARLGCLMASTFNTISKAIASNVAVGTFAGIGIALDITNIILNSINLSEGSKSEVHEKIVEVTVELQTDLDIIHGIYSELWNVTKKASGEFFNSLIFDQLRMNGKITLVAHEVYQDVLQETRRLRVYDKRHGGNRGEKRERKSPPSHDQMEPCVSCLFKVMNFFKEADKELDNFFSNFSEWENRRKENITHLYSIFDSLQETRKLNSAAQYVGLIGGAVAIGAGLFHLWIPYVLLPILLLSVVIVMSTLVINILHNRTQFLKRIKESIELCRQDHKEFDKIVGWFRCTHEFDCGLDELFGSKIVDFILKDLRVFCGSGQYTGSSLHKNALKSLVSRIFYFNLYRLQPEPFLQEASIAVILTVLLNQQRSLFHIDCFYTSHRLGIVKSKSRDCRWTFDLLKHVEEEALFLEVLESVLSSKRGLFLNAVYAFLKLKKPHEDKIQDLAVELQKELNFMKKVSCQLSRLNQRPSLNQKTVKKMYVCAPHRKSF